MSDESVRAALRSCSSLVLIEAAAGCGKTFQAAEYARELASSISPGRLLILTHTHAACSVFSERTKGVNKCVEIRTIDSFIVEIATSYHKALDLPNDVVAWARNEKRGFEELAVKVAKLTQACILVPQAIVQRYPAIICDEHQDSGTYQQAIITELHKAGAKLRIFGDPMQQIYERKRPRAGKNAAQRWRALTESAQAHEILDKPHRWVQTNQELGEWICHARETLRAGKSIDLGGELPCGLDIVYAENASDNPRRYRLAKEDRPPIDLFVRTKPQLLVLAVHNDTVRSLRASFARRFPIWEGHTREAINVFVDRLQNSSGNATGITNALIEFMSEVSQGFTLSSYGRTFLREVEDGCSQQRRGKSNTLQGLARTILETPNHRGAGQVLRQLGHLIRVDPGFKDIHIDLRNEFWEAIRLGEFDGPNEGLAEITHRRARSFKAPYSKSISTVHKAKGLECDSVVLIPCDRKHFGENARCLLYVALSRAKKCLQLVIPRIDPSPLLRLPEQISIAKDPF